MCVSWKEPRWWLLNSNLLLLMVFVYFFLVLFLVGCFLGAGSGWVFLFGWFVWFCLFSIWAPPTMVLLHILSHMECSYQYLSLNCLSHKEAFNICCAVYKERSINFLSTQHFCLNCYLPVFHVREEKVAQVRFKTKTWKWQVVWWTDAFVLFSKRSYTNRMLFYKVFSFANTFSSHSCKSKVTTSTENYQLSTWAWRRKPKKVTSSLLFAWATDPKTYSPRL